MAHFYGDKRIFGKRMKRFITAALNIVAVTLLLKPIPALPGQSIRFGAGEGLRPFMYMENGRPAGIDYQIFIELQKRIGFKGGLAIFPTKRMVQLLIIGKLDAVIHLYYSKEREEKYVMYSALPIRRSRHYIFVKKENLGKYSEYDVSALYGKRVGRDRGIFISTGFDNALRENRFILDEAVTTIANIEKLMLGRIDCYISMEYVALEAINRLGLKGKITPLPKPVIPEKATYIAISKKAENIENKKAFLDQINAALASMHNDGTIKRIEQSILNLND